MLFNLATNARDAMPNGGVLRIETTRVELTEERRLACGAPALGEYGCLYVGDTGVGMDEETRRRMFEPFFTTKPAGRGTGLGLATVYGLVKQHGAGIEVDTASGKGTRFRIYFPVAEHSAAAASRGEKGEPETRGGPAPVAAAAERQRGRRAPRRARA